MNFTFKKKCARISNGQDSKQTNCSDRNKGFCSGTGTGGYLYFLEDPKDIRKKMVFPTEQLKDKREELLAQVQQMENEICRVLNLKEKKQLRELEQKMLLGLKKDEEVTP